MGSRPDVHSWADEVVDSARAALVPLADPERAVAMAAYMKQVAPFLGVTTPDRRRALGQAWTRLGTPGSDELGSAASMLFARAEREFHYAAADLIDMFVRRADERFLAFHVEPLLTTVPWWDTVDALGSAAVTPLCRRFGHADVIDRWSESGDRWLVRAAIQHQRGRRHELDVTRVLSLCDRHWSNREFFVAKAIGWALRDLSRVDPAAVTAFLDGHPAPNAVAVREARRGLDRARRTSGGGSATS